MPEPRTLLLTRPEGQSRAFAAALAAQLPGRFRPVVAPLIEITPIDAALDLRGVGALVFTSANGVEQFAARWDLRGLPAFCVGAMTAKAAERAGFAARSAGGDVAALADMVIAAHRPKAGDVLHLRGRHSAGDVEGRLAAAGLPVRAAAIYDQAPRPLAPEARALLARGDVDALAIFSARSAKLFSAEVRTAAWDLGATDAVSLSISADSALNSLRFRRRLVTDAPTRDGMIAALGRL